MTSALMQIINVDDAGIWPDHGGIWLLASPHLSPPPLSLQILFAACLPNHILNSYSYCFLGTSWYAFRGMVVYSNQRFSSSIFIPLSFELYSSTLQIITVQVWYVRPRIKMWCSTSLSYSFKQVTIKCFERENNKYAPKINDHGIWVWCLSP